MGLFSAEYSNRNGPSSGGELGPLAAFVPLGVTALHTKWLVRSPFRSPTAILQANP